ncbi:multiprotein bridging factor aMBF1 [archaeon]|nr:TIGR00270 family protein [Nanoarchaeota archaeon]MBU4299799.1 TIGR00270 family protein [Nanoarchaeota archaeon]MBU4451276.1 TIGR00270 family protein [Nanoarchaeota archaeon]MCG2724013.1 multiprotein bridging factor aMBF1 [archaeon]
MNCEICDKRASNIVKIRLEGAVMNVCESCAKLGERIITPPVFAPRHEKVIDFSKEDIVENYASLVKNARERKGWTQEHLAREIQEKEFLIPRIEQGRMQPTIFLAKKLQHALGIQLIAMVAQGKVELEKLQSSGFTLGDLIKVKKK